MTVTNQTRKQRDVGDGVVVTFNFSFPILNTGQLQVFKIDTSVSPEVLGTALVLGVDFTATINPSTEGGTVTYTVAPGLSKTEDSFITRVTDRTQEQAIPTESNFPETQVENGLDKGIMLDVEADEELGRAIKLPINTTLTDIELPDAEADKVIGWNTAATNLENKLNPAAAATAAAASAAAALVSENNASTSETNAGTSATNAATSETNAAASAASIDKTKIVDADGDTGIESERTPDGDILHAKTAGIDRWIITAAGERTMPTQPAFLVEPSVAQNNLAASGADITILWGTEIFDQGGDFISNTFTAPVTGRYLLCFEAGITNIDTAATEIRMGIKTSNRVKFWAMDPRQLAGDVLGKTPFGFSDVFDMDANDTAIIIWVQDSGVAQADIAAGAHASFSGCLLA